VNFAEEIAECHGLPMVPHLIVWKAIQLDTKHTTNHEHKSNNLSRDDPQIIRGRRRKSSPQNDPAQVTTDHRA
jgi:hypothetical protein